MRKRQLNALIDTLESRVADMSVTLKATITERDLLARTNVDLTEKLAALQKDDITKEAAKRVLREAAQKEVVQKEATDKVVTPRTRTRKKVGD